MMLFLDIYLSVQYKHRIHHLKTCQVVLLTLDTGQVQLPQVSQIPLQEWRSQTLPRTYLLLGS